MTNGGTPGELQWISSGRARVSSSSSSRGARARSRTRARRTESRQAWRRTWIQRVSVTLRVTLRLSGHDGGGRPELDRSEQIEQAAEPEQEARNPDEPPGRAPANVRALQRGRPRVRQLQRGFWIEVEDEDLCALLSATLDYVRQEGGDQWNRTDVNGDLGKSWAARESASADIKLILCSTSARRVKKPQPHNGPADVPIRKSFLLLADDKVLTTDWEMWANQAPSY